MVSQFQHSLLVLFSCTSRFEISFQKICASITLKRTIDERLQFYFPLVLINKTEVHVLFLKQTKLDHF